MSKITPTASNRPGFSNTFMSNVKTAQLVWTSRDMQRFPVRRKPLQQYQHTMLQHMLHDVLTKSFGILKKKTQWSKIESRVSIAID